VVVYLVRRRRGAAAPERDRRTVAEVDAAARGD
jgi:hypothetical protein